MNSIPTEYNVPLSGPHCRHGECHHRDDDRQVSYNIHQASPTSLCHLQSEESNGAEEQFDAQPRSV